MRAFLVILVLLAAGVIGLGLYRNWFTVTVDRDKMEADANAVKAKWKGKPQEQKGTVKEVEMDENRLILTTPDGKEMTVHVTDASKVRRNGAAGTLADLKAGDEVSVQYRDRGGKNEAASVTVGSK